MNCANSGQFAQFTIHRLTPPAPELSRLGGFCGPEPPFAGRSCRMLLASGIITLLILLTALFVAAEFAVVGARRSRLRRLAEDGNAARRPGPARPRRPPRARPLHRRLAGRHHALQPDSRRLRPGLDRATRRAAHPARRRAARPRPPSPPRPSSSCSILTTLAMIVGELVPKSHRAAGPDANRDVDGHADAVVPARCSPGRSTS